MWKMAKVISVPEKGKNLNELSGCRPISLLSYLNKIAEKSIKNRLLTFLKDNDLFVDEQFGFRMGRRTVDQLVRVTNEITINSNDKKHTEALLLDITDKWSNLQTNKAQTPSLFDIVKKFICKRAFNLCRDKWILFQKFFSFYPKFHKDLSWVQYCS